jgi:hypothetical protein
MNETRGGPKVRSKLSPIPRKQFVGMNNVANALAMRVTDPTLTVARHYPSFLDRRHFEEACGFVELGLFAEANDALENIDRLIVLR